MMFREILIAIHADEESSVPFFFSFLCPCALSLSNEGKTALKEETNIRV